MDKALNYLALARKGGMAELGEEPVGAITRSGKGYLVLGDCVGYLYLIDGATGETLYQENLGSNIEASPVVFNNKLVVGTRGCQVWGVEIN